MERGHFDTRRLERLNNPGRLKELRPEQLLTQIAGISRGMTCLDLGAGTGVFALPMAEIVGATGTVYAVDNSRDVLDYLASLAHGPQLRTVNADVSNTGLSAGIIDVCLAAFILHELSDRSAAVAEAFRVLKPGGAFVIVEWRMDSRIGPPADVKVSPEKARELLSSAGFTPGDYREWSINHYVMTGTKPAA
jgi:ubiquinone/menaquinone biosynthesis C-methylase UbiE